MTDPSDELGFPEALAGLPIGEAERDRVARALQNEDVIAGREFTMIDFRRLTPDLSGIERLAVFLGLPVDLQREAWRELDERIKARSADLAQTIVAVWDECKTVPLVLPPSRADPSETQTRPKTRDARRRRTRDASTWSCCARSRPPSTCRD